MQKIYIFTAANPIGQKNLSISIQNPIQDDQVFKTFSSDLHDRLNDISARGDGFYAWGAKDGANNKKNWEAMQKGDYIFCVYNNEFCFFI
jgi:hypothetical protein